MYKEMVSIITPTYNASRFVEATIQSVLSQTYQNFEMIIVDDCSTDNTIEIVERYSKLDHRIKVYKLKENSGAAVVRNKAIEMAQGRYIAFLDSDDLWDEEKLEKHLEFIKEKNAGISFTSYRLMKEDGTLINKEVKAPEEMTYKKLLKNTIIGCLTVIIDREVVGDFRMPLIRAGQDTATWLSILKRDFTAYGYEEVLSSYRLVEGSISSNKKKALKRTWNMYRTVENFGVVKSSYYFINYAINAAKKRL